MHSETMDQMLVELSKPFHPSRITWRPGALSEAKDKALALAYADLRAYQNRLDEVCGLDWSVSYTPWGDRIICHLTVKGVTRSSTGEPDNDADSAGNGPLAGTIAEAQAFKRACAMFGLGRYLYHLPTVWVEYDAEQKRFTEKAWAKLNGMIAQHYQQFLEDEAQAEKRQSPNIKETEITEETEVAKVTGAQEEKTSTPTEESLLPLQQQLESLGQELYGEQWEQVRNHNVKRLVGEHNGHQGTLTQEQMQTLIRGLQKLKRQRLAA